MYICVYIHIYIYIYIYVCIYIYIYICVYIDIFFHNTIYIHYCINACYFTIFKAILLNAVESITSLLYS